MNASLLDEWIFEIQHDKEGNESLIWRNSSDKKKVKMNFQNVKDVHSITLDNSGHCYNLKFSLKREEIELVKDEQVDTLDEYYQEKSSGNHFHPISGMFLGLFLKIKDGNEVEILIDGLQTFGRYFHVFLKILIFKYMMQAEHTIDILGWELSLTFGLLYTKHQKANSIFDKLQKKFTTGNWKNLSVPSLNINN
jgi:hypothetical protein